VGSTCVDICQLGLLTYLFAFVFVPDFFVNHYLKDRLPDCDKIFGGSRYGCSLGFLL